MTTLFHYSNFQILYLGQGVVAFEIPDQNFHCRIWYYQRNRILDSVAKGSQVDFSEERWDVDCHYNDVSFLRLSDEQYKIACLDTMNDQEDIFHEYVLSAADFELMLSKILPALE
jgi:hypothetical protein